MTTVSQHDIDKVLSFLYNRYTKANYDSALKLFLGVELSVKPIQEIVSEWGENSILTIRVRKAALERLVAYKASIGECDPNLLNGIIYPTGRPSKQIRALTEDELDRFLGATRTLAEKLMAVVLFDTGLRAGFVPLIRYKDLRLRSFKMQVKKGAVVDVYTTEEMQELGERLMQELGADEGDYIFTDGGEPVTYKVVYTMFKRLAKRAKVEDVTPHSARHTFATRLADSGATMPSISALMGHKKFETTMRYVHPNRDAMQEAVQNIAKSRRHT